MMNTKLSVTAEIAAVALIAAIVWWIKWAVWGLKKPIGDGLVYMAMAGGKAVAPPWSFHILSPRLAGLFSPHDPVAGFAWIAALSFVGTSVAVDILLRKADLDITLQERALGVSLFMATCTGVFMFRNYFLTDSLSYFLLAVACVASLYRRDELVALTTLIGIFNRETALFIIPVWLSLNIGGYPLAKLLRRLMMVFLPAVVAFVLLHYTSLFLGYEPSQLNYLRPETMAMLWRGTLSWLGTENVYYGLAICVFLAYGPVWLVAAKGLLSSLKVSRGKYFPTALRLWAFALPVIATLVIVDWRRGFQPLFPAMIISAILGVRVMTERAPKYCWYLFAVTTAAAAAATTEAWEFKPIRRPVIIAMGVWLSVAIFVWVISRFNSRDGATT